MPYCCVVNCNSDGRKKEPDVKFYNFPWKHAFDAELREKWVRAIHRRNPDGSFWQPKKHSLVCSKHFHNGEKSTIWSHPNSVPSIFPESWVTPTQTCVFHNCKNRNVIFDDKCIVKFYSFPTNPTLRQAWIRAALRTPGSYDDLAIKYKDPRICSDHFFPEDFELRNTGRELKPYAVPIIFQVTYRDEKSAPKRKGYRKILDPFFEFDLKHCSVEIPEKERRLADEHLGTLPVEIEIKDEPDAMMIDVDALTEIENAEPPFPTSPVEPVQAVDTSESGMEDSAPLVVVPINIMADGSKVPVPPKSSFMPSASLTHTVGAGHSSDFRLIPVNSLSTPPMLNVIPLASQPNQPPGEVTNKPVAPLPTNLKRLKFKKLVIRETKPSGESSHIGTAKHAASGPTGLPDHDSYTLPTSLAPSELDTKTAAVVSKPLPAANLAPLNRTQVNTPRQPPPPGGGAVTSSPNQPLKTARKPHRKDDTNDDDFRERLMKVPLAQLMIFHPGVRAKVSAYSSEVKVLQQQIRRLEDRLAKTTEKLTSALRSTKTGVQPTKQVDNLLVVEIAPKCECNENIDVKPPRTPPKEDLEDVFCDAASKQVPSAVESQEIIEDNERLIKKIIGVNNSMKGKDITRVVVIQSEDLTGFI